MESKVLSDLKAQTKGKATAKKAPPAATKSDEAVVEVATTDKAQDEVVDAPVSAEVAEAVVEALAEPEEEEEPQFVAPTAQQAMFLPKAKCQACLFLLPSLPRDSIFKGPGLPPKGVKPKENPCFVEATCPARNFQMLYDPMTEERVRGVFQEYIDTGDIMLLQGLYDEAEEIGEASHERLHDLLLTLMEQIRTEPVS